MATHHGNAGVVRIAANTVAEMRSFEIEEAVAVADDTAMGDTWETHLANGNRSWKATAECWWDETDTTGQVACTIGASVTLNMYPEGTGSGATYYTGTATVIGISSAVPKDGTVSRTLQFQGNGALSITTV